MAKLYANRGDPDQTPHSAASDLGLHCYQLPFYGYPDYNRLIYRINYFFSTDFFFYFMKQEEV